ncbi:MAG: NGG1p interacting factor NIF3 [Thermoplasmata archaeon]
MKLKDIYKKAIEMGSKVDPRGEEAVKKLMEDEKEDYEKLEGSDKEVFDLQRLENPFQDTRILHGDDESNVGSVMAGIDIATGEVVLADRLNEKGTKVDLIISHHPSGLGIAGLHEVMHLQKDVLYKWGVPINVAESLMDERIDEVERKVKGRNYNKTLDAAKLLDMPFMCVHTPADNLVNDHLIRLIEEKELDTVKDVLDMLKELPEYHQARKYGDGPFVLVGSEKRKAGKVVVEMTGGTQGSKKSYEKLAEKGVGTLIGMHLSEEHRKEVKKHHLNYVIAGHMASDSLGLNLFLDELEKEGVEIHPCSGFIRHSRNK